MQAILLPNLRVFECSIQSKFSDAAVLALLNVRLDSLKTVKIIFERQQEFSTKAEIEKFASQGGINCQLNYVPAYNQPKYLASDGTTTEDYNPQ